MAKDAHFWHHPGWWFILLRKWHDPTFTDIYLGKYHESSMDHFSNPKWWMIHLTRHLLYASVFVDTGRKQSSVRMMRLDMWWTSMPWHIKWGKRWALKGSIKVFFLSLLRTTHHLTSILRYVNDNQILDIMAVWFLLWATVGAKKKPVKQGVLQDLSFAMAGGGPSGRKPRPSPLSGAFFASSASIF